MNRTETMEAIKDKLEEWSEELDELQEQFDNLSDNDEDWSDDDGDGDTLHDLHMRLENLRLTYEEAEQSDEDSFDEMFSTLESEMDEFEESLAEARTALKAA